MATAPVWGKDLQGHLIVLRPALDKATCTIMESWCSARFVSNGGQTPSATLQNRSMGADKRWVDQHSIGLGNEEDIALTYRLHDGTCGMCFADATQALATPGNNGWTFVDYHEVTLHLWSSAVELTPALRVKAQRLQLLLPQKQKEELYPGNESADHICYLQQWARTPDASVFVLSHGSIHISFSDQWELLVTSTGAVQARYASKSTELPIDAERRMEYLQEALSKMSYEVTKERTKTPPRRIPRTPSLRKARMIPLIPHKAPAALRGSLRSLLPKKLFTDAVAPPKKKLGKPTNEQAVVVKAIPSLSLMDDITSSMSEECEMEEEAKGESSSGHVKGQETARCATDSSKVTLPLSEDASNDHDDAPLDENRIPNGDYSTRILCLDSLYLLKLRKTTTELRQETSKPVEIPPKARRT